MQLSWLKEETLPDFTARRVKEACVLLKIPVVPFVISTKRKNSCFWNRRKFISFGRDLTAYSKANAVYIILHEVSHAVHQNHSVAYHLVEDSLLKVFGVYILRDSSSRNKYARWSLDGKRLAVSFSPIDKGAFDKHDKFYQDALQSFSIGDKVVVCGKVPRASLGLPSEGCRGVVTKITRKFVYFLPAGGYTSFGMFATNLKKEDSMENREIPVEYCKLCSVVECSGRKDKDYRAMCYAESVGDEQFHTEVDKIATE